MAWRDTMRPARFFVFDGRAVFPLLVFLMHIRVWTLLMAIASMAVFYLLERKGLTAPAAFRALRSWLAGRHRPVERHTRLRRRVDYGGW